MTQLEQEMLINIKETLVSVQGALIGDPLAYEDARDDGLKPHSAWWCFGRTLRKVDVSQELEDIDLLLDGMVRDGY